MRSTWWKDAVIYQIYPKSFNDSNQDGIGDLNGITEKLPYLSKLGIDAIWISPVYLSPQIDNGYDITDYYQIDPMFGTMDDMRNLVHVAHALNIKVIMDFVANHTSDQSSWFQESRKSKTNKYSDYYIWRDAKEGKEPNNWGSNFGGSAWTWDSQREQYYLHYYAKEQPDLNWENENVRTDIFKMMAFWKEIGIDGWRMDVITSISKELTFMDNPADLSTRNQQNGPRMHEFIHEINKHILAPLDMMAVGEAPAAKASDAQLLVDPKREELDMIFTFEHMHVDRIKGSPNGRWALKEPDFIELKKIMSDWQIALRDKGWNALYFENHDRARIISRWGDDEQYRYECATAFATILHGMQGTPFIYQGEEIGMTNPKFELAEYIDIELKGNYQQYVVENQTISESEFLAAVHKVSRDNARTPMQWNDELHAGFSKEIPWFKVNPNYSTINVKKDQAAQKSIFHYYQQLIDLRHTHNILRTGSYELLLADHPTLFVYQRETMDERWYVLANLSKHEQSCDILKDNEFEVLIHNYMDTPCKGRLRPYESMIVRMKK